MNVKYHKPEIHRHKITDKLDNADKNETVNCDQIFSEKG